MNFFKVFVIIAFIISTIFTVSIHPNIHRPMIIEDENFTLVRISDTLVTTNKKINVSEDAPKAINKTVPIQEQNIIEIQPEKNYTPKTNYIKTEEVKPRKRITKIPVKTQNIANNYKNVEQKSILDEEIPISKSDEELLKKVLNEASKQLKEPTPHKTNNFKNPYMTEQEEIIAWNIWRSNIHNKIMRDSEAGVAPFGTIFSFSFVVDKYKNISNIKVETSNPNCMDIAKYKVKPAIANLQNNPILTFPKGTQRNSTVISGSFLIGTEDKFSTPSNFSDFERVTH